MAIIGTHTLLYTTEPEKLRAMLRDVFGFTYVDAHDGWLIFALPPAEMGIHPAEGPPGSPLAHSVAFICDDIHATVRELRAKGIVIDGEPEDQGWGITAMMSLPGGAQVMVYQARHPLAIK
jgi:catechol 2,3-dioxygenase-like lactoylglutathione lyase family enzyme